MSRISVLGDSLLSSLRSYFPEYVEDFYPGVSASMIQLVLAELKQDLPDDFYELYKWRNGNPEYFPHPFSSGDICQFNSLDTVAQNMTWEWFGNSPPMYKDCPALPFITIDSEFVAVVLGRSYSKEAHIAHIDEVGESYLYCDSITSMLESTVECFLSSAVFMSEEGYIEENQQLVSDIWSHKNPYTLRESMSDLAVALETVLQYVCQPKKNVEENQYSLVINSLVSALRTLRRFQPTEAILLVQDNLSRMKELSLEKTKGLEFTMERWLEETNSIEE